MKLLNVLLMNSELILFCINNECEQVGVKVDETSGIEERRLSWLEMTARIWSVDECEVNTGDKLTHFLEDCKRGLQRMENFKGESEPARGAVKEWLLREALEGTGG